MRPRARTLWRLLSKHSGAAYAAAPSACGALENEPTADEPESSVRSARRWQRPKSESFTVPPLSNSTLVDLRSAVGPRQKTKQAHQ